MEKKERGGIRKERGKTEKRIAQKIGDEEQGKEGPKVSGMKKEVGKWKKTACPRLELNI